MENIEKCELWQGDCLELMKDIPSGSVDCILADVPEACQVFYPDLDLPFITMEKCRLFKQKPIC